MHSRRTSRTAGTTTNLACVCVLGGKISFSFHGLGMSDHGLGMSDRGLGISDHGLGMSDHGLGMRRPLVWE